MQGSYTQKIVKSEKQAKANDQKKQYKGKTWKREDKRKPAAFH